MVVVRFRKVSIAEAWILAEALSQRRWYRKQR